MAYENGEWIMRGMASDDPECLKTPEEVIRYIDKVGFLPLFRNDIQGFSLEEHTEAGYWWTGDTMRDPWEWREIIARTGKVAYGKFFDGKAGFVSRKCFPYLANFRRDGYDFDALWDDEKASLRCKKIMDLYERPGAEYYSYEIRQKAGFSKGGEKNFEGTITKLQMMTYLCVRDFRQKKSRTGKGYGMHVAVYVKPEDIWGYDFVSSKYCEDPSDSAGWVMKHLTGLYPDADKALLQRFMGIKEYGSVSDFAQKVYEELKKVPKGKVVTYGQLAKLCQKPEAARAVGNALHVNPYPDEVPCFKVLNSKGELAANFGFGGAAEQERRLIADGIEVTDGRVDLSQYQWDQEK